VVAALIAASACESSMNPLPSPDDRFTDRHHRYALPAADSTAPLRSA